MEEALRSHLLANVGVTALVATRVTWGVRVQGSALPALNLTKIDGLPDYTMQGPSGLISSRVQVDAWGGTYASAKTAARAAITVLSGMDALVSNGDSPETFTELRGGFIQGERDFFERGQGGQDLHRVSVDVILWHN